MNGIKHLLELKSELNEIVKSLFEKGFEIHKADGEESVILIRKPEYTHLCGYLELLDDGIFVYVIDTLYEKKLVEACSKSLIK